MSDRYDEIPIHIQQALKVLMDYDWRKIYLLALLFREVLPLYP